MNKVLFSILTEFVTDWRISSDADKHRDYISDKSDIADRAINAIEDYVTRARIEEAKYHYHNPTRKKYFERIAELKKRLEDK